MKAIKYWVLLSLLISTTLLQAQEQKKKIKFYGFVNSQAFFDTRKTISAREGMVYLFPAPEKLDHLSRDLSESISLNHLSMASRLGIKIQDMSFNDFSLSANLEGDFTGMTNSYNNGFRLRQAWVKLNWEKVGVRIGQYWHPLYCPEARPKTLALNTGAPFHPFGRYNQIAIDYKLGNLKGIFTIAMQRDYSSKGPKDSFDEDGTLNSSSIKSSAFQRSAFPNINLQLQYQLNKHLFGISADFKQLLPRKSFGLSPNQIYAVDDKITSWAFMGFANLSFNKWNIKASGIWGQNLSDMVMIGGYYEHSIEINQKEGFAKINYGNSSQVSLWTDISSRWESKFQIGLFAGYLKNLGYESERTGRFYGIGENIATVLRISPRAFWKIGKFMAGPEIDFTAISYGIPDVNGSFNKTKTVSNVRFLAAIFYFF